MAKVKTKQERSKKPVSVWDSFKGLKAEGGWRITYCPETCRGSLYANDGTDFRFSDISLSVLKRMAELRYGIKEEDWKSLGE